MLQIGTAPALRRAPEPASDCRPLYGDLPWGVRSLSAPSGKASPNGCQRCPVPPGLGWGDAGGERLGSGSVDPARPRRPRARGPEPVQPRLGRLDAPSRGRSRHRPGAPVPRGGREAASPREARRAPRPPGPARRVPRRLADPRPPPRGEEPDAVRVPRRAGAPPSERAHRRLVRPEAPSGREGDPRGGLALRAVPPRRGGPVPREPEDARSLDLGRASRRLAVLEP